MPASGNVGTGVIGVPTDLSDQSLGERGRQFFRFDRGQTWSWIEPASILRRRTDS